MSYAQKKPIENAHIVRERDRRRFRELSAVLFLAVPVGAFLLVFTCQNVEVIRLGRQATDLQKQRKQLEDRNKSLQLELDRLTALDTVERKARELGFAPAEAGDIVTVAAAPPLSVPQPGPPSREANAVVTLAGAAP